MKTIVLPHGYRFRKTCWGKLVLQKKHVGKTATSSFGFVMESDIVWKDVKHGNFLDDESLEVKCQ